MQVSSLCLLGPSSDPVSSDPVMLFGSEAHCALICCEYCTYVVNTVLNLSVLMLAVSSLSRFHTQVFAPGYSLRYGALTILNRLTLISF